MTEITIGTDVNQVEILNLSKIRGKNKVIDLLKVNLDACFQSRGTGKPSSFGPTLLCGPCGTGKTLVCKALHTELGNLDLIETNGEILSNPIELISILLSATENTTVFIDECQGMNSRSQHILLTALSEKVIYIPKNNSTKNKRITPLENFTLLLATTHEYYLHYLLFLQKNLPQSLENKTSELRLVGIAPEFHIINIPTGVGIRTIRYGKWRINVELGLDFSHVVAPVAILLRPLQ